MLACADVVLLDKTGTLTLGKPHLTEIISLNGVNENAILTLAASAERYSEHPLAQALREAASERQLALVDVRDFEALPGKGVRPRSTAVKSSWAASALCVEEANCSR